MGKRRKRAQTRQSTDRNADVLGVRGRKTQSTKDGTAIKHVADGSSGSISKEADTAHADNEASQDVGLSLNWNRAIYINRRIDDALLQELTPVVLQMKQQSGDPITLGIDSPGGSVSIVEALLGLLRAPDQDGRKVAVYTACTNVAYSAAASLLAFGDYSVAFPHSHILYHDIRYAGMDDITPAKALRTARELERGNAAFSLKLAHCIRRRILWVYIDLRSHFSNVRKRFESFAKRYDDEFSEILPRSTDTAVDIVGFSLSLYSRLSSPADQEIAIDALNLLHSWMQIEKIEKKLSEKRAPDSLDLVQSMSDLVAEIRSMDVRDGTPAKTPEIDSEEGLDTASRSDIKLLLEVIARRFAGDGNLRMADDGLDLIIEDFAFIKDITSSQHIDAITKMMIDYDHVFFGRSIADEMKNAKDSDERKTILAPVYPQARVFWLYVVLICRCLCRGEHLLTPGDAQLLGLVDEVLGGGPVLSKREWRRAQG